MRAPIILICFVLLLTNVWAAAQMTSPAAPAPPPNSAVGDIKIDSPRQGEKVSQSFVTLKYQLLNPGATAQGLPTYNVRLDDNSAIETTSTTHTFTGLKPGVHTIIVELIDANGTPIPGSRKQVEFVVLPQPAPTGGNAGSHILSASYQQNGAPPSASVASAGAQGKAAPNQDSDDQLPSSSTALPLLSIIGFGVLVGGIVSALKTRY